MDPGAPAVLDGAQAPSGAVGRAREGVGVAPLRSGPVGAASDR
jgi:hypothetical protein